MIQPAGSRFIRLFVNKVFLYDDKLTITFNTGNEEVTITDVMLAKIENSLSGANLCLSNHPVHHQVKPGINSRLERCSRREFFICNCKSKI